MDAFLVNQILWALGAALLGAVIFSAVGLIAGTPETATVGTATLLCVYLGMPPIFLLTFNLASLVAKHLVHAIPTALLGVPGDTLAVPMLEPCAEMRRLGLPHIALRKMISAGIIASLLAIPVSVGFAMVLAPYGDVIKNWSGPIFTCVGIGLAYSSAGRWTSVLLLVPFAFFTQSVAKIAHIVNGKHSMICIFLGLAMGPMFVDLLAALSPVSRSRVYTGAPKTFWTAPDHKTWSGFFPNPVKILTRRELLYTFISTLFSGLTFASSSVGVTVLTGQVVQGRIKSFYEKVSTSVSVMNAATESTFLCEIIIPLMAFGLPLSAVAAGAGFPLFNAPPIYSSSPVVNNLHNLLSPMQYLLGGMIAVIVAGLVAYPLSMNYARSASVWVMKHISQEALLSMFASLMVVLCYFEAGALGIAIAILVGIFSGILSKLFGFNTGVQFMTYFAAPWIVLQLFGMK